MVRAFLAIALLCLVAGFSPVMASPLHPDCNITMPCTPMAGQVSKRESKRLARGRDLERRLPIGAALERGETQRSFVGAAILPHPAGCPRRAFCGCGAAVEVFGRPVRSLWLAANWLAFPRTSPAPGMVAARRGHVFVIREVLGNGTVLAYDANSGGRRTRLHVRSLAGFAVVNPHAGRYASAS